MASDYPFGIFWLPLWYLLITPLISTDYPFGIFWLPLWYLLITSLVSSDYPFGIIKLFIKLWLHSILNGIHWLIVVKRTTSSEPNINFSHDENTFTSFDHLLLNNNQLINQLLERSTIRNKPNWRAYFYGCSIVWESRRQSEKHNGLFPQ